MQCFPTLEVFKIKRIFENSIKVCPLKLNVIKHIKVSDQVLEKLAFACQK